MPLCQGPLGFLLEETCSHMMSLVHCTVGKDVVGWYCKKTCAGSSSPSSKFVVQHGLVSKPQPGFVFGPEPGSGPWRMQYICIASGPSYSYSATSVIWCELWIPSLSLVTPQWFYVWETSPLLPCGMESVLVAFVCPRLFWILSCY